MDGTKSGAADGAFMQTLLPLAAATIIGVGGGGFLGFSILAPMAGARGPESASAVETASSHADSARKPEPAPKLEMKELPPVVTNLAGDGKSWIRLQSAIVYEKGALPDIEPLVAALMSDIAAFLGTLDLQAIQGPGGLRRLQEDLNERAAIRSDRRIRELIVETLVVQ